MTSDETNDIPATHRLNLTINYGRNSDATSSRDTTKLSPDPFKVLIIGDSMTAGSEGDYTWRYRLWQWLASAKQPEVAFVGPYAGTQLPQGPSPPQPPRFADHPPEPPGGPRLGGEYARDVEHKFLEYGGRHFAGWGRTVEEVKRLVKEIVEEYKPNLILLMCVTSLYSLVLVNLG